MKKLTQTWNQRKNIPDTSKRDSSPVFDFGGTEQFIDDDFLREVEELERSHLRSKELKVVASEKKSDRIGCKKSATIVTDSAEKRSTDAGQSGLNVVDKSKDVGRKLDIHRHGSSIAEAGTSGLTKAENARIIKLQLRDSRINAKPPRPREVAVLDSNLEEGGPLSVGSFNTILQQELPKLFTSNNVNSNRHDEFPGLRDNSKEAGTFSSTETKSGQIKSLPQVEIPYIRKSVRLLQKTVQSPSQQRISKDETPPIVPFKSSIASLQKRTVSADIEKAEQNSCEVESLAEDGTTKISERLRLSTWGLPHSIVQQYSLVGVKHMFEWQADCLSIKNVLRGGNLVYSAPTSSGKTLVAELLMFKCVLEKKKRVILILPFVSVAHEKVHYLKHLSRAAGIRTGGYMGNLSPPGGFQAIDIAVCTIEKANGLINRLIEENCLNQLGMVVVDELHMVGDPHRGYLLELLLTKLLYLQWRSGQKPDATPKLTQPIQIVGMSATLPNLNLLAHWLQADLYCTDFRPVPLVECIKVGDGVYLAATMQLLRRLPPAVTFKADADHVIQLCIETVCNGNGVLVFCPTKNWCEALAQSIAKEIQTLLADAVVDDNAQLTVWRQLLRTNLRPTATARALDHLRRSPAGLDAVLAKTVTSGVAFHHAGLTFDERDIIEGSFRDGSIKILTATSTLSSGVNLPARRVIVRTPLAVGGAVLGVQTYRQMIGRAGRKGLDTEGESILVCKENERTRACTLAKAQLPLIRSCLLDGKSHIGASMKRALLEVVVSGAATSYEEVRKYVSCTMWASTNDPTNSEGSVGDDAIHECLQYLEANEFIRKRVADSTGDDRADNVFVGTSLGHAVLASSLPPEDGLVVFRDLGKARRSFVLENDLHIVYQVTPLLSDQWYNMDWQRFLRIWEQLPVDMQRVAELVGVTERYLVCATRGRATTNDKQQALHLRFYTALALHDLIREVPLTKVADKFGCNRGMLQSLQQSAATFSGMVTAFCHQLGWSHLELLLNNFQSRLHFGVQQELCDLVQHSCLNGQRARILFDAGFKTVADLANASVLQIENVLQNAGPFESGRRLEGETAREADQRLSRSIWLPGQKGVTMFDASKSIINEARDIVTKQVGVGNIQWNDGADSTAESHVTIELLPPPLIKTENILDGDSVVCTKKVEVPLSPVQQRTNDFTKNEPLTPMMKRSIKADTKYSGLSKCDSSPVVPKSDLSGYSCPKNDDDPKFTPDLDSTPPTDVQTPQSEAVLDTIEDSLIWPSDDESEKDVILTPGSCPVVATDPNQLPTRSIDEDSLTPSFEVNDDCEVEDFMQNYCSQAVRQSTPSGGSLRGSKEVTSGEAYRNPVPVMRPRLASSDSTCSDLSIPEHEANVVHDNSVLSEEIESSTDTSTDTPKRLPRDDKNKHGQENSLDSQVFSEEIFGDLMLTGLPTVPSDQEDSADYSHCIPNSNSKLHNRNKCNVLDKCASNELPGASDREDCADDSHFIPNSNSKLRNVKKCNIFEEDSSYERVDHFDSNNLDFIPPTPPTRTMSSASKVMEHTPQSAVLKSSIKKTASKSTKSNSNSADDIATTRIVDLACSRERIQPSTVLQSPITVVNVPLDVTGFTNFIKKLLSLRKFSICFACSPCKEDQVGGIGHHILRGSGQSSSGAKLLPSFKPYDQTLTIDGLAFSWDSRTSHYIDVDAIVNGDRTDPNLFQTQLNLKITIQQLTEELSRVFLATGTRPPTVVGFDLKEQYRALYELCSFLPYRCDGRDPKTAAWMLRSEGSEQTLSLLIQKHCPEYGEHLTNFQNSKHTGSLGMMSHQSGEAKQRASIESAMVLTLMNQLMHELKVSDLRRAFIEIEMPSVVPLLKLELNGFGFESDHFEHDALRLESKLRELEDEAFQLAGRRFSMSSPKEVDHVLYAELNLPRHPGTSAEAIHQGSPRAECSTASRILRPRHRVAKAASHTNKKVLQQLENLHLLPAIIMEWRRLQSALTRIVLPTQRAKSFHAGLSMHRIHCRCDTVTATGRVVLGDPGLQMVPKNFNIHSRMVNVSSKPNATSQQNANPLYAGGSTESFPIGEKTVLSLRDAFVPFHGGLLVSADFSQLELRVLAHLSDDDDLRTALNGGVDVFRCIAARWKRRRSVDDVTETERHQAKQMCYGMVYGIGAKSLGGQLEVDEREASVFMESFKAEFPGVGRFITETVEQCRLLGYVETLAKRKRYLPEINSVMADARSRAERQAINSTVQGSAADLVKRAMVAVDAELARKYPQTRRPHIVPTWRTVTKKTTVPPAGGYFVLELFDELIYETRREDANDVARILKTNMETAFRLTVDLPVNIKIGKSWGALNNVDI